MASRMLYWFPDFSVSVSVAYISSGLSCIKIESMISLDRISFCQFEQNDSLLESFKIKHCTLSACLESIVQEFTFVSSSVVVMRDEDMTIYYTHIMYSTRSKDSTNLSSFVSILMLLIICQNRKSLDLANGWSKYVLPYSSFILSLVHSKNGRSKAHFLKLSTTTLTNFHGVTIKENSDDF